MSCPPDKPVLGGKCLALKDKSSLNLHMFAYQNQLILLGIEPNFITRSYKVM